MNPLFPLSFLLFNVESAYALETGNIQGTVEDETGVPVPGAEVVLGGADLAGERRSTTEGDGTFRFDGLSPGNYELNVLFKGATIARAEVRVSLGVTTNVPIPAKMGGVSEEIEVVGFKPVIDTTASSFQTSLGEDTIQNLPVGRSFQDVVNTIPGVSGRVDTSSGGAGDGNPSVRGEGQYGNNFMIDGVSTRDPATKTFGSNVDFDAIEEITVYTDGAPAEYGQFTGMVVNVVTKDGGDEHHGSLGLFYGQHAWFERKYDIFDPAYDPDDPEHNVAEIPTTKRRFRNPNLAATAGGPIIPEKLWYFGSITAAYNWTVPEGVEETENAVKVSGFTFLGKATWFPSSILTLRYIINGDYQSQANWDLDATVSPEAASDRVDWTQSHRLTATLTPDDKNTLEARIGYLNINLDTLPVSRDENVAARLDDAGVLHDNAFDFDYNDRNRVGGGLSYTRFLDNILGDHRIKAGADYWYLVEKRNIVNTGKTTIDWVDPLTGQTIQGDSRDVGTRYLGGPGFPCDAPDYSDCLTREHWTNVGKLGNTVRTFAGFIQDDWTPIKQLNLNLGVRLDVEDGRNDEGEKPITQLVSEFDTPVEERSPEGTYGPAIMPAPRLGFSLDPWADGKTKFTGHYGQYYDLAGNNLWSWANARSASGFVRYVNDGSGDADPWVWSNTQDPEGQPLIYADNLKPARMDKINIGIEREIIPDLAIGIRGILSRTKNVPEDVDVNLNDWYIMNSPIKQRVYRALELTVNKSFDDVWQVFGAYTLQESFGHTPGQFELAPGANSGSDGNNVGVYLDDIGDRETRESFINADFGWILQGFKGLGHYSVDPDDPDFYDEAGWYGYLPYHSFHAIKLNGSYTAPFGTTFGLVYEFDSGHAWQKRTFVPFYGYDAFGQGRGTRMMPSVHYIDFRVAHKLGLGAEHRSVEATLDIFNLLGFAQSITYYENDAPGFGSTLYRQAPRSVRVGLKFRY